MEILQTMILRLAGLFLHGFAMAQFLKPTRAKTDMKQVWVAVGFDFTWVLRSADLASEQLPAASRKWVFAA